MVNLRQRTQQWYFHYRTRKIRSIYGLKHPVVQLPHRACAVLCLSLNHTGVHTGIQIDQDMQSFYCVALFP